MYVQYQAHVSSSSTDDHQRNLLTMLGPGVEKYGSKHEMQNKLTKSLVDNLIVGCGMPISIVSNDRFKKFMSDAHPKYSLPSRSHLTDKLIPSLTGTKMELVKAHLKKAQFVSLTVDIWTDRRMHSYMAMTAHTFIDCVARSALLQFASFKGSHTGERIAAEIENTISSNDLKGKIMHVITDNASNMKKACVILQQSDESVNADENDDIEERFEDIEDSVMDDETLFEDLDTVDRNDVNEALDKHSVTRLSCFAHSLQLTVKDAMDKCTSARPVLAKCSKMANLCHQSATFRHEFEVKFGNGRSVPSTNATRWSSTFHQLSSVNELDQQALSEVLRASGHDNLVFTAKDQAMLSELVQILQPFAEVTRHQLHYI